MSEPSSPASVASADIAAEFAALTVEEQEQQRAEWSQVKNKLLYLIFLHIYCFPFVLKGTCSCGRGNHYTSHCVSIQNSTCF